LVPDDRSSGPGPGVRGAPGGAGVRIGKEVREMTKRMQVYKCEKCGNIVEVLHEGVGELVCCGEPMKLFEENTVDAAKEKHVPVIEKVANGYLVKVGSVAHPMEEKHYIEWIQLIADGHSCRKFLKPGDKPEAFFETSAKKVGAREYCNIHGLWSKE
jgi:superoxide reductase